MAVSDVVRLRLHYRLFGQLCQSGMHFQFLTIGATATGLATDFDTNLVATFAAAVAADVSYESITVEAVAPPTLATIERDISPDVAGTQVGEALPPANAAVFSLRTPNKGRRYRGRFYLSGIERTFGNAGQVDGAGLTALQALATALDARYGVGGTSADYRMVVHSPEDLTAEPPRVGTITTDVTSIVVDPVIRTQRRRQIGVGS